MKKHEIQSEEERQILYKLLEQELGYDIAHKLIERAKLEYAVIKTNEKLERRDW